MSGNVWMTKVRIGIMIAVFALIALFFVGVNFYVGNRLFRWLSSLFPYMGKAGFTIAFAFVASTIVLGFLPLPSAVRGIFSWISAHWIGLFLYLFLFFLATDLLLFIGRIVRLIPSSIMQNARFYSGTIAVLLALGVVSYGLYNANQIKYVSYDIQTNKPIAEEMKIVFIADLHLGSTNSEGRLEGIVQGINSLNPDLVCMVGDVFNDDYYAIRDPEAASAVFKMIESRYGVFACFGNHDGGKTMREMMDFLERSNVRLLNDEYVIIDDRLVLVGRLDSSPIRGFGELKRKSFTEVKAQMDTNLPVVVMDHNPANIDQYGSDVDLILSGHTHRGQLFPGSIITGLMYTVHYGYYQKDTNSPHCIVTQGVGTWLIPMCIGSDNEISSVKIR